MRAWRLLLLLGLAGPCRCSDGAETDLHDAHRELELLAQRLKVPTELPTVVLVGHHNDGKSGLLEALLGIRLSHVGSSITTRRPLRIHAQHDARFETPVLYLTRESGEEQACTASELRAHVEAENERLAERGAYDSSEIRVRLVWRHAASLVLIDTPGLLSAPAALGETADAETVRQSEEVQALVLKQLAPPNRLIMCLEDTSDWQVPLTRAVVQRVDPKLSRTVLVATKLDAKLSQFSMPEDLHRLLDPRALLASHPDMLAGPIFTSVPPVQGQTDVAFLGAQPNIPHLPEAIRRIIHAFAVPDDDDRRERKILAALHDLRDAVDVNHPVRQLEVVRVDIGVRNQQGHVRTPVQLRGQLRPAP